jgi:hypothetical protein
VTRGAVTDLHSLAPNQELFMHSFRSISPFAAAFIASALSLVAGCGHGPTRTSTTTTEVSERPTTGGQSDSTTTEIVQTSEDGSQSTETTGTTHTVTPPT